MSQARPLASCPSHLMPLSATCRGSRERSPAVIRLSILVERSPAVIRLSILVQGGAYGAAGPMSLAARHAARGMRPPAGPRAAQGCPRRPDGVNDRRGGTSTSDALAGRQVSEIVGGAARRRRRGRGAGTRHLVDLPRGLSRAGRRASRASSGPEPRKVALRPARDRAAPGRRDGAPGPRSLGQSELGKCAPGGSA